MTRAAFILAALGFIAVLHFTDRVIAGIVQCESAATCPVATERGIGRP